MTDWRIAHSDINSKPLELDTISSPDTVYKRRNFRKIHISNVDTGSEHMDRDEWEYEEMTMTHEEYNMSVILSDSVNFKHDDKIIDDYTQSLIDGGVI